MEGHMATCNTNKHLGTRNKEAIPNIDIVSQMWLGLPIHESIATPKDKDSVRDNQINKLFVKIGTPTREIIGFRTLWRVFLHGTQKCYPNERPNAVPNNHLHFIQLSQLEKIDHLTSLSEGFHIIVRFELGLKKLIDKMPKEHAWSNSDKWTSSLAQYTQTLLTLV